MWNIKQKREKNNMKDYDEKCECGGKMVVCFRFTDWYNDYNDEYGTFEQCQKLFDEAVKNDPEGRYSIYDVSICSECEETRDEGIVFNEQCEEYKPIADFFNNLKEEK
jgi:hypothetical protein